MLGVDGMGERIGRGFGDVNARLLDGPATITGGGLTLPDKGEEMGGVLVRLLECPLPLDRPRASPESEDPDRAMSTDRRASCSPVDEFDRVG